MSDISKLGGMYWCVLVSVAVNSKSLFVVEAKTTKSMHSFLYTISTDAEDYF